MLKLKKITIENFRGIRFPITIDFRKGGNLTSALVYGRNGTGKSSIVDAWEWFNNFDIRSLNREGVSLADLPHKASNGKKCYISVDFHHATINNVLSTFNTKKIATPTVIGEYDKFKELSSYPNYLRYSDLQDFVYKTKTERYKYIAKFFGLEKFTLFQDSLQTTINKLSQNLRRHQQLLDDSIRTINSITNLPTLDENSVINFINSIGKKHDLTLITHFNEAEVIKKALEKIVETNPVAKELSIWKTFQLKQNRFYPISSKKENCINLENLFKL